MVSVHLTKFRKLNVLDYDELAKLVDYDALAEFRKNALNPEHPVVRGTAQNPDIFMQGCEARNRFYDALPEVVEEYMEKVSAYDRPRLQIIQLLW